MQVLPQYDNVCGHNQGLTHKDKSDSERGPKHVYAQGKYTVLLLSLLWRAFRN